MAKNKKEKKNKAAKKNNPNFNTELGNEEFPATNRNKPDDETNEMQDCK